MSNNKVIGNKLSDIATVTSNVGLSPDGSPMGSHPLERYIASQNARFEALRAIKALGADDQIPSIMRQILIGLRDVARADAVARAQAENKSDEFAAKLEFVPHADAVTLVQRALNSVGMGSEDHAVALLDYAENVLGCVKSRFNAAWHRSEVRFVESKRTPLEAPAAKLQRVQFDSFRVNS